MGFWAAGWGAASAQAFTPAVPEMKAVTVEGERPAPEPAWNSTTTRKELDAMQVRDWRDLGQRVEPGVNYNRQTHSINIRGLGEDRVLTRVDGIRLPWLDDGARGVTGGLQAFDFNSLSQVDIVRGADARSAGSGALGAAVQLRTLSPADLLQAGKTFGALVKTDYDSADNSRGANAALAGQVRDRTFWLLQAGVRRGHDLDNRGDVGGYGMARSQPNPEDNRQSSFLLKAQQRFEGGHQLGLTGEYFKRHADINNMYQQGRGTNYAYGENSTTTDVERQRVSMDYAYTSAGANSLLDSAQAMVYWQRVRLDDAMDGWRLPDPRASIIRRDPFRYGYPSGPYGRDNSLQESIYGVSFEGAKRIAGQVVQAWTFGGEWYGNQTRQYSSGYDNCAPVPARLPAPFGPRPCSMLHTNQADMPEVRGSQWALWAQDELLFAGGRYSLAPSLRYDHYEQKPRATSGYAGDPYGGGMPSASSAGRYSPQLLATWNAREQLSFYAQYGLHFKAPNASQLYMNYGGAGSYLRLGNPDLKPETSKGWELGAKMGNDDLGGAVSFFDSRYQDFIDENVNLGPGSPQWQPGWTSQYPLGVTTAQNRARVRIYGAEASAHWAFTAGWRTWGTLAWAVGRDQDTGQYLNSVAPLKVVLGLGYERTQWGVNALLTAAAARTKVEHPESNASAKADFQAPGYGVVDLNGYWAPAFVKGLRVQAGIFNLFDKKYWEATNVPSAGARGLPRAVDWYTEPGRSVRVALTYQY